MDAHFLFVLFVYISFLILTGFYFNKKNCSLQLTFDWRENPPDGSPLGFRLQLLGLLLAVIGFFILFGSVSLPPGRGCYIRSVQNSSYGPSIFGIHPIPMGYEVIIAMLVSGAVFVAVTQVTKPSEDAQ